MIIDVELTKVCTKCGVEKSVDDYYKKNHSKHGIKTECKCCSSQRAAQHRQDNKEAIAIAKKAYVQANKEAVARRKKAYRQANREAVAEYQKAYRQANKEAVAEQERAFKRGNRHLYNAYNAKRRATKLQATPAWADLETIKGMYQLATIFNRTGLNLHVDHIVPLQSDLVCGLHCETNLQLLPASDNKSKSNRHWPDMPF